MKETKPQPTVLDTQMIVAPEILAAMGHHVDYKMLAMMIGDYHAFTRHGNQPEETESEKTERERTRAEAVELMLQVYAQQIAASSEI